tara:strand:+ start:1555 stop:2001 length:447 start_codon:yes stop_codon:yes gene_type:complete
MLNILYIIVYDIMIREGFEDILGRTDDDYSECIDSKYYIGSYTYDNERNILLMVLKIPIWIFFTYERNILLQFLYWASMIRHRPRLEIIQVDIMEDGTYNSIVKTSYIKIFQRKWRKICKDRQEYLKSINLKEILKREITGSFSKRYY